jgi:hypothetical protein
MRCDEQQQQQHQQYRHPHRISANSVTFAPLVTVKETYKATPEEAKDAWYNRHDLMQMKTTARRTAAAAAVSAEAASSPETPAQTTERGLETCCYERQRRRRLSIKCTMSAHKRGMTSAQVAAVSIRCSEWVTRQAFVVACHDFAELYRPDLLSKIPHVESTPPAFPFGFHTRPSSSSSSSTAGAGTSVDKKRPITPEIDDQGKYNQQHQHRHVRQRISC